MLTLSKETEAAIRAKAAETGRTPDELLRTAFKPTSQTPPWRNAAVPAARNLSKDELIARMEAIAARSAARPMVAPGSADEIIGYDDFGLPR